LNRTESSASAVSFERCDDGRDRFFGIAGGALGFYGLG
jgi:hypothetical protein